MRVCPKCGNKDLEVRFYDGVKYFFCPVCVRVFPVDFNEREWY